MNYDVDLARIPYLIERRLVLERGPMTSESASQFQKRVASLFQPGVIIRREAVDAHHWVTFVQQPRRQMEANETGGPCHEIAHVSQSGVSSRACGPEPLGAGAFPVSLPSIDFSDATSLQIHGSVVKFA